MYTWSLLSVYFLSRKRKQMGSKEINRGVCRNTFKMAALWLCQKKGKNEGIIYLCTLTCLPHTTVTVYDTLDFLWKQQNINIQSEGLSYKWSQVVIRTKLRTWLRIIYPSHFTFSKLPGTPLPFFFLFFLVVTETLAIGAKFKWSRQAKRNRT